jgi:hypothetical protein
MNYNYKKHIIIIIVIIIGLVILNKKLSLGNKIKEGFQTEPGFTPWPKDVIRRFKLYQFTMNENDYKYNMYVLQQQATAEEAEILMKTGHWPWPQELKDEYTKAVRQTPLIKIDPGFALESAMSLYNQTAAKRLLGWNAKEGHFLIHGSDIGRTGTMPVKNTIKCSSDVNNSVLQKTIYSSYNLWNGYKNSETTEIKNEDIPAEVPGFSFVNGACNPCAAINQYPQYNCPFKLVTKNSSNISPVWKNLWGL